eukprot:scaffold58078_cov37-Tisochrysis_lutea.AAC.2
MPFQVSHACEPQAGPRLAQGVYKSAPSLLLPQARPFRCLFGCACTEFWYIALYAMHFTEAARIASMVCNVVQMFVAMTTILDYDKQQRGLPCPPTGKPKVK